MGQRMKERRMKKVPMSRKQVREKEGGENQ